MQPAVEVSANYSASLNGPGRCNLVGSVHKRRKRIVAETIPHRCRSEPSRDTGPLRSQAVCVRRTQSGARLADEISVSMSDTLKNISLQSVSLILYHADEKTIRCDLSSLFPG